MKNILRPNKVNQKHSLQMITAFAAFFFEVKVKLTSERHTLAVQIVFCFNCRALIRWSPLRFINKIDNAKIVCIIN